MHTYEPIRQVIKFFKKIDPFTPLQRSQYSINMSISLKKSLKSRGSRFTYETYSLYLQYGKDISYNRKSLKCKNICTMIFLIEKKRGKIIVGIIFCLIFKIIRQKQPGIGSKAALYSTWACAEIYFFIFYSNWVSTSLCVNYF